MLQLLSRFVRSSIYFLRIQLIKVSDPAVYYAHLASNRGRAHEDIESIQGPRSGLADGERHPSEIGPYQNKETEVPPLRQMNPTLGIKTSMWYV